MIMFERLKRMYEEGKITKGGLRKAVQKKWITKDQYREITGEEF